MMRPEAQKPSVKQPIDRTPKQDKWTKPSAIACFDSIAQDYFPKYNEGSLGGYIFRERKARVLELLSGTKGNVLDVGCGSGVMVQDVLNLGCTFWGVDGSSPMIAECRKRFGTFSRTHFSVGNAMALPFADAMFDAAVCIGVIDRVIRPEIAIREMGRVLKPGGTLLISFPNLLSPYAFWRSHVFYPMIGLLKRIMAATRTCPQQPDLASAARLWTLDASSRHLERLIGDVREISYYNFALLLSPLDELCPTTALRLAQRLERLRGSRFRWLGAGFIVKAKKRF